MIFFLVVCKNGSCLLHIDRLSPFLWIYFRASIRNLSCLNNPVRGSIMLQSIGWTFRRVDWYEWSILDCLSSSKNVDCISSISTRRIATNSYYEFTYVLDNSNSTTNAIIFNESSIYSYEFLVDNQNIGGTIHLDFKTLVQVEIFSSSIISMHIYLVCPSIVYWRYYSRMFIQKPSPSIPNLWKRLSNFSWCQFLHSQIFTLSRNGIMVFNSGTKFHYICLIILSNFFVQMYSRTMWYLWYLSNLYITTEYLFHLHLCCWWDDWINHRRENLLVF